MTKRDMIIDILNNYSCLNTTQIRGFIIRKFNVDVSPGSAAGTLKPLIAAGLAAKSPDPLTGKMVYWLTDYGKEKLCK